MLENDSSKNLPWSGRRSGSRPGNNKGKMVMEPYWKSSDGTVYYGNVMDVLKEMPDEFVHMCVTSPPYWGLRNYDLKSQIWDGDSECEHVWGDKLPATKKSHTNEDFAEYNKKYFRGGGHKATKQAQNRPDNSGQFCQKCEAWKGSLGLEPTPKLFLSHMVQIFAEVKRVLRKDGTCWVNMGDSYTSGNRTHRRDPDAKNNVITQNFDRIGTPDNLKPKDLCGIPWKLAFALQEDGWYLRSAIPWMKKNGMPESCKDRPCVGIEYIFLLSKNAKYFYNNEAIKKVCDGDTHARYARGRSDKHKWDDGGPGNQTIGKSMEHMVKVPSEWDTKGGSHSTIHREGRTRTPEYQRPPGVNPKAAMAPKGVKQNPSFSEACKDTVDFRERRVSDWFFDSFQGLLGDENGDPLAMMVNSKGFSGAHFAVFPEKMIEPCILAGSPKDGIVLDPFLGSGTTAIVSYKHSRKFIGIELSKKYLDGIAISRIKKECKQRNMF
jgi:DNA modification methylase